MAVSFFGAGAAVSGTNVNLTPALPASTVSGDLLLCCYAHRVGGLGTTTSTGWTDIGLSSGVQVFWAIQDGTIGDPTIVANGTPSTVVAQCAAFRGVNTADPFDVISAAGSSNGAQQDIGPITAITPAAADGAIIVVGIRRDDWTSVATLSGDSLTWVEIGEPDSTAGGDAGLVWDYALWSGAAPSITDKTFSVTGGAALDSGDGWMLSLNAAAGGTVGDRVMGVVLRRATGNTIVI